VGRLVPDPFEDLLSGQVLFEDAAPGPDNAALRKLALAVIEVLRPSEAGIAADAVIQLAHILLRLDGPVGKVQ
jgi:hypothetical protein